MATDLDFNKIYNEYYPGVLSYISNFKLTREAEDITQEVFEKVNRGLPGFKGKSKLSTWIYRIATNTALDTIRSASFKRNIKETVYS